MNLRTLRCRCYNTIIEPTTPFTDLYPKAVIRSSENLYHRINVNLYQNAAIVVMVTVRRLKRCCVHFTMDKVKSLVLCFML